MKFDDLLEFAKKLQAAQSQRLRDDALVEAFRATLLECRLASFDIFDTLVVRRVANPTDVFLHLERHALFRDFPFAKSVAHLRIEAEQAARRKFFSLHGSGEVMLSEIYAEFCRMTKLSADAIDHLVDAEEIVEVALCRPNPAGAQLFRIAQAMGKSWIAVSDTYHRIAFLHRLLQGVGFPFPPGSIFASSEHRVHKQGGRLFEVVCAQRNLPPSSILHVGDHPVSDYRTPQRLGLRALLHDHFVSPHPNPGFVDGHTRWVESAVRAMRAYRVRCKQGDDFWQGLGYCVFGPLFVGFCQWLHNRMRKDEIQRAYFLLRDGRLIERVYRSLYGDSVVESSLLHSSRRAMVLPIWTTNRDFAVSNLLVAYEPRPAREFMERLGLDPLNFKEAFRSAGLESLDTMIDMRRDGAVLLRVLENSAVQAALADVAADEKGCLVRYLRDAGFWERERTAVVDLGWNGTIQKALQMLTQEEMPGRRLKGYYLGTLSPFTNHGSSNVDAASYWVHGGEPMAEAEHVMRVGRLLEIVSSTAEGSLTRFSLNVATLTPAFGINPLPIEQLVAIERLQVGVLEFAQEWLDMANHLGPGVIPLPVAVEECLRLQFSPTGDEAARIGDLSLTQDMGTSSIVPLARFRSETETPEALWTEFLESPWREGLANRPCAKSAALRTLLWLRQSSR